MSNLNPFSGHTTEPEESFPVRASSRRPWSKPLALLLAGLCAVFLLLIAFLVGSILGDLASDYVQRNSFLPDVAAQLRLGTNTGAETGNRPVEQAAVHQDDNSETTPALVLVPARQVNILLLGSDDRLSDGEPPRTDTMILLTLDLERHTAGMISLTRDLWLPIPGYNLTTKINTAYALGEQRGYPGGGAQLAKDTVSSFIGQPVHYYVQADFNGFVRFIDEIGGVTVDVRQAIYDPEYPTLDFGYQTFHLDAGLQHLDGDTALKYARTRNMDSDYGRAARQQQLLQAIVDKVLKADMIPTLAARAPQLMNTMWGSVSSDISPTKAAEIAYHVRSNSFELRQLVLDDHFGEESYSDNGAWILLPNRELIRPALSQFFNPAALPAIDARTSSVLRPSPNATAAAGGGAVSTDSNQANVPENVPVLDAGEARLEILNGTGQYGVAARVRQELEDKGWNVVSIGDADRSDYRRTLLVNYNTDESLVREIGRQLNLTASLYELPGLLVSESTDLRIVIGQDYLTNASSENR